MENFKDYYEILGVDLEATLEEIKTAYRLKSKKVHPDVNKTIGSLKFKRLTEAYETLGNSSKRAAYDVIWKNYYAADSAHQAANNTYQHTPPQQQGSEESKQSWNDTYEADYDSSTTYDQDTQTASDGFSPDSKSGGQDVAVAVLRFLLWHRKLTAIVVVIVIILIIALNSSHGASQQINNPLPNTIQSSTQQTTNSPAPCITGDPIVTVDHVAVAKDPVLIEETDYTITGKISNPTPYTMELEEFGFYLGNADQSKPPALKGGLDETLNKTGKIELPENISYTESRLLGDNGSMNFKTTLKSPDDSSSPLHVQGDPTTAVVTYRYPDPDLGTSKPTAHWQWFAPANCPSLLVPGQH